MESNIVNRGTLSVDALLDLRVSVNDELLLNGITDFVSFMKYTHNILPHMSWVSPVVIKQLCYSGKFVNADGISYPVKVMYGTRSISVSSSIKLTQVLYNGYHDNVELEVCGTVDKSLMYPKLIKLAFLESGIHDISNFLDFSGGIVPHIRGIGIGRFNKLLELRSDLRYVGNLHYPVVYLIDGVEKIALNLDDLSDGILNAYHGGNVFSLV